MVEKRVKKFGQGSPPPFSGNARKKTFFFQEGFPYISKEKYRKQPNSQKYQFETLVMIKMMISRR